MKLKMSFWNQIKMLTDLIIISLICFLLLYFLPRPYDFKLIFFLLIPYFILFFFPVLILHLNYLNQNKGVITINNGNIIVKKNVEVVTYNISQIREMTFYLNGSKDTVNGVLAFSNYHYVKINLLDGSFFIITSLYSRKIDKILEENFKSIKMTTKKVFYPIILS